MDVAEGTFPVNSVWRRIPIPACNCDYGSICKVGSSIDEFRPYAANASNANCSWCSTGLQFDAAFDGGCGPPHWSHMEKSDWVIMDTVRVPQIAGDYVLRWRWDCDANPQIWTHCADVTVATNPFIV